MVTSEITTTTNTATRSLGTGPTAGSGSWPDDRPARGPVSDVAAPIGTGDAVEVRSRFDQRWTPGFTVAGITDSGYRLRRTSDASVLPAWFPREQLRRV